MKEITRKQFMGGMAATVALGWRGTFAAPMRRQRNYLDMTWWDPYVENITDSDTYLRRKFRQDVTDKTTGVGVEALKKILAEIVASGKASGESWRITKAKCFAAQMEDRMGGGGSRPAHRSAGRVATLGGGVYETDPRGRCKKALECRRKDAHRHRSQRMRFRGDATRPAASRSA